MVKRESSYLLYIFKKKNDKGISLLKLTFYLFFLKQNFVKKEP